MIKMHLILRVAASCLKHTIKGDANLATVEEVEKLMGGRRFRACRSITLIMAQFTRLADSKTNAGLWDGSPFLSSATLWWPKLY